MWYRVDFESMFVPSVSVVEMFLRGTITYVLLLILMRTLRREAGGVSLPDVLFIVIVADASQNAMAGEYKSITEGIVLVGTIAFWNHLVDYLSFKFPKFERLMHPSAVLLIRDGKILHKHRRHEMVTMGELLGHLREQGVKSPSEVKECWLEGDGMISVIKKENPEEDSKPAKRGAKGAGGK
jgi:uncharacterized membrane protein YcaP (DUF421 family)